MSSKANRNNFIKNWKMQKNRGYTMTKKSFNKERFDTQHFFPSAGNGESKVRRSVL